MKRLLAVLTAVAMLAGGGATPSGMAEAAESSYCWLYCEAVRDVCWVTFRDDRDICDAYFQGCVDGCQYPGGPTSGGGGGAAF